MYKYSSIAVTQTGSVVSLGQDYGTDLVHVEAACAMAIEGLVASKAPGHFAAATNLCKTRPDHLANTTACVELWSDGKITISSEGGKNGEVLADTANAGGTQGNGWIDIFSRGDVAIHCDPSGPFCVHANQSLTNGRGGQIRLRAQGGVDLQFNAIQASSALPGGRGGSIEVQARTSVDMTSDGTLEARGAQYGHGGSVKVRAFNGGIVTDSASKINVFGGTPPDGAVALTACTGIGFPPGTVTPVPPSKSAACGGTPPFPSYVPAEFSANLACTCVCL